MKKKSLGLIIFTVLSLFLGITLIGQEDSAKKKESKKAENPILKDTDKDGFVDFIEEISGLNSKEDECLYSKIGNECGKVELNGVLEREYFLYIMDQSDSMKDPMDGRTRMDVAKEIMTKYIQSLPENFTSSYVDNPMRFGLFAYGTKSKCEDMEEIQSPFKPLKKKDLIAKVKSMNPSGGTPIARSLDLIAEMLKSKKGKFNVILITDGLESCEGNPIESARKLVALESMDRSIKISIIGLGVPANVAQNLEQIAKASNGTYNTVKTASDFEQKMAEPYREMIQDLEGLVCLQKVTDKLIECENRRVSKAASAYEKLENPFNDKVSKADKEILFEQKKKSMEIVNKRLEIYNKLKKDGSKVFADKAKDLAKVVSQIHKDTKK